MSKSYQPLTALIPSLPKGILTGNMAHLFYPLANLRQRSTHVPTGRRRHRWRRAER